MIAALALLVLGGAVATAAPTPEPACDLPAGLPFPGVLFVSPRDGAQFPLRGEVFISDGFHLLDSGDDTVVITWRNLDSGDVVPFVRTGNRIATAPDALTPHTHYELRVEVKSACSNCNPDHVAFETSDVDTLPTPRALAVPTQVAVHAFTADEARACGFPAVTSRVALAGTALDDGVVVVANRTSAHVARPVGLGTLAAGTLTFAGTLPDTPVQAGDVVDLALSPRGLAGAVGPAIVVRTRAVRPDDTSQAATCSFAGGPSVALTHAVPQNARIPVRVPFEDVPLELVRPNGEVLPLAIVDDSDDGHVYAASVPLVVSEHLLLRGSACPICACAGCAVGVQGALDVGPGGDNDAPAAPVVHALVDVVPRDVCDADATFAVQLAPGRDDVTAALDLRYDIHVVRDGVTLAHVRGMPPAAVGDDVLVRVAADAAVRAHADFPYDVDVTAIDLAGHRSAATTFHHAGVQAVVVPAASCASVGARTWTSLAVLALLLRRRRAVVGLLRSRRTRCPKK